MVNIPVLVPPVTAELAVPYLTPATFTSYPTWLDLDNLIPGGIAALQASELAEVLLAATQWAVDTCEGMRLDAHFVQGENQRTRPGKGGRLYLKPRDIPVRAITGLSFGFDPSAMTALSLPDPTMWNERGRQISFAPGGGFAFTGPQIQFGGAPSPWWETYVTWSYVAGYPNAAVGAGGVAAGAPSVLVTDPTSVLPGDVLRIYDEGITSGTVAANEAVTVAATYVPAVPTVPPTPTSVPLAANTVFAHSAGIQVTGFPRDIMQAVIAYAVALLMREDVAGEVPQSRFGPASRTTAGGRGGQAGGLINDAYEFLARHRPTHRSAQ